MWRLLKFCFYGLAFIFVAAFVAGVMKGIEPEPTEAEKQKAAIENEQFQAAFIVANTLRKSMKDPSSFDLEQLLRMADGTLCIEYRAKNSFNATVPGRAVYAGDKIYLSDNDGNTFVSAWNIRCAGKRGEDLTSVRYGF